MLKSRCWFLFIFFALAGNTYVYAETPYTVTITVKSQSEADRLEAFRQGLIQIVNSVSKDPLAATKLKINVTTNVLPYVDRYFYKKIHSDDDLDAEETEARNLVIDYNPIAIDNLLKDVNNAETPQSGDQHKLVLWLALMRNSHPDVLSSENVADSLSQQLASLGRNRNIEIILPLMDIDDLNKVSVDDVDEINLTPIQQASVRYAPDQILIGSIKVLPNKQWQGHWLLWLNKKRMRWDSTASSYQNAILEGIGHAADLITTPTALAPHQEVNTNHFVITVGGIDNVSDYAELQSYFQQLPMVSQLQIVRVKATNVVFDVIITGDKAALLDALRHNKHLIALPQTTDQELNYTWSGADVN